MFLIERIIFLLFLIENLSLQILIFILMHVVQFSLRNVTTTREHIIVLPSSEYLELSSGCFWDAFRSYVAEFQQVVMNFQNVHEDAKSKFSFETFIETLFWNSAWSPADD